MGPKKPWKGLKHIKRGRSRDESTGAVSSLGEDKQQRCDSHHEPPPKKTRSAFMDLGRVKGHQAVIGTCDVHHDRQAAAELIDLLDDFAEKIFTGDLETSTASSNSSPSAVTSAEGGTADGGTKPPCKEGTLSVEESIKQEAHALRSGSQESRKFASVDTGVKGVTMVCVVDKRVDVVKLVDNIFSEIRATHKRYTRFLQRIIPLAITSYAEVEDFKRAAKDMISKALPPVADSMPSNASPPAGSETGSAPEKPPAIAAGADATPHEHPPNTNHDRLDVRDACPDQTYKAPEKEGRATRDGGERGGEEGVEAEAKVGDDIPSRVTSGRRWTFRVDPRRRNSGISRKDLIEAAVSCVGEGHSVTMKSPDVSRLISAPRRIACS